MSQARDKCFCADGDDGGGGDDDDDDGGGGDDGDVDIMI